MRRQYIGQFVVWWRCVLAIGYLVLLVFAWGGTWELVAQNQTLLYHKRSRNLNREGYRAYQQKNWNLALKKFAQSMQLDPYYTYPVYNSACVLSLRGRPQDANRIYRLLLEVLLQESGKARSIHQAKMQKDPDLAWFRRSEPELFILLNNVILDYDSQRIYRKLRQYSSWSVSTDSYRRSNMARDPYPFNRDWQNENWNELEPPRTPKTSTIPQTPNEGSDKEKTNKMQPLPPDLGQPLGNPPKDHIQANPSNTPKEGITPNNKSAAGKPDIGYVVPAEECKNSITVTPDDPPRQFNESEPTPQTEESPFDELVPQEFPGFDKEKTNGSTPFVPQSLRQNLDYQDQIRFDGYRYIWHFEAADGRLFEMQGFFVIRGNVLILETFASSPTELEGLPFNWQAFRSLHFIYQPQIDEFHAINSANDRIRIY